MKALTVWQPWASLIIAGAKPYEFRGWRVPRAPAADVARFATFFDGHALICLGTTGTGAPIHPAARGKHRIPRDAQPILYELEAIT